MDGAMSEPKQSPRDRRDLGGTLSEGGRRTNDERHTPQPKRDPRLKGGGGGVERPPRRG
jgi:hypothetical protein